MDYLRVGYSNLVFSKASFRILAWLIVFPVMSLGGLKTKEAEILNLWGNKKSNWVVMSSQELCGGMIIIWNLDLFKAKKSVCGEFFLLLRICAELDGGVYIKSEISFAKDIKL